MPELSIISVNIDSPDWAKLLIMSIRKFTSMDYEIIFIDNNSLFKNLVWIEAQEDVKLMKMSTNIGHGAGMDFGTTVADSKYVCVLDIDSHIMHRGWERDLFKLYDSDPKIKMIGCVGPEHKPLHPPLFFYEKEFILNNGISFKHVPPLSTDTAQKSYWDIKALGFKVHRLVKGKKRYNCIGDEIEIAGKPTIYHHWYGTRFCENNPHLKKLELDGVSIHEYFKTKDELFNQSLVKNILGIKEYKGSKFRDYHFCKDMMDLNNGEPWIESGAIKMLDTHLKKDMQVLEIGAGSSTGWFAQRAQMVVSFESNECWHAVVTDDLEERNIKNVAVIYDPDYPEKGLRDTDNKFDVILLDGETLGRENVVSYAIDHIKKGGLIVLDDAQRTELYAEGIAKLDSNGWKKSVFNDGKGARETAVWRVI